MVRRLRGTDAAAYQSVRLRALREHPEAFGSSEADEQGRPLSKVAEAIDNPDVTTFGAFEDEKLVGIAVLVGNARAKTQHRASVNAMYVAPEVRGRGIGRSLMEAIIAYAQAQPHLEVLTLAVTVGNHAAWHVYTACGFSTWGIERDYLKLDDRYYHMEWMIRKVV
jgi:RimJ/RimL family protein N-acetyltransferase